jgi:hypothetical protein
MFLGIASGCSNGDMHFTDKSNEFKPGAGEFVADNEAGITTKNYQIKYEDNNHAVYFNKENVQELIKRAGNNCVGVRIYRARNKDKKLAGVMVGVDEKGNDIVDQDGKASDKIMRVLISYEKCPDNCDEQKSVLDSNPNGQ